MSRHVLDAGALIALDANDREAWVRLKLQLAAGLLPATHGGVVAQVWRDAVGRQARLAQALKQIEIVPLDDQLGRRAGQLLGLTGGVDVVDAAVAAMAKPGDTIVTSDPDDINGLLTVAGLNVNVLDC